MTDQELKDLVAGNAIAIKELRKSQLETDKQMKDSMKETKDLKNELRGMGLTQGAISEELIAANFKKALRAEGEEITTTQRNIEVFKKGKNYPETEIDIIGINGTKIFIGETKTKLTKNHINKLINKTIPKFKKYLHKQRYGGLDLYGVVGARVFADKEVKEYAKEQGLYILKEYHNGNAKILKESLKTIKSL